MNPMRKIFALILLFSLVIAQDFGRRETGQNENKSNDLQTMGSFKELFAFEEKINPDTYLLGPGDELGLNILTAENITYPLNVTPTGDLFIPSVGVVRVAGISMTEAVTAVENYIHTHASVSLYTSPSPRD